MVHWKLKRMGVRMAVGSGTAGTANGRTNFEWV